MRAIWIQRSKRSKGVLYSDEAFVHPSMPARIRRSVCPGPLRTDPADSTAGLAHRRRFPPHPRLPIIAFQQAVAATNEGQRNFAQLRTKFEPKQTQLKAQNDEIDSLKKQLQDAGANLSETERDSRLRTIDEKTKSLQRSAEDAQNEASSAMNDMYQQLAQKVYAVLDAYSNQTSSAWCWIPARSRHLFFGPARPWTSPRPWSTRTTSSPAFRRNRHPLPRRPGRTRPLRARLRPGPARPNPRSKVPN